MRVRNCKYCEKPLMFKEEGEDERWKFYSYWHDNKKCIGQGLTKFWIHPDDTEYEICLGTGEYDNDMEEDYK